MKKIPHLAIALFLSLSFLSCKKESKKTTSCTTVLYGSKHVTFDTSFTFGTIDLVTGSATSIGSYTNRALNPEGVFNTSDNCYYIFGGNSPYFLVRLYKISLSGAVSVYTPAVTDTIIRELVYNRVNSKLYSFKHHGTTSQLVEISISGTSFTATPVATAIHSPYSGLAVDNITGALYFTSADDSVTEYMEKYIPGSSATTVTASTTTGWKIFGMRYNINDNQLYGIRRESSGSFSMIRVDPSTGVKTSLSTIAGGINVDFYSMAIDPCNNRYLLSTLRGTGWSTQIFEQLDMSGAVVQRDTLPYNFHGMDVNY